MWEEGLKRRFEDKFTEKGINECWNWEASLHKQGYGWFRQGEKMGMAHRFSYKLYKGEFPEHLKVLHTCDNPSCVNPGHLFLGTDLDNSKDKMTKGRGNHPAGEKRYEAKLTMRQVRRMREFSLTGAKNYELAPVFGVSKLIVSRVINNKTYKEEVG